jgi:hypothetical protein
MYGRAIAVALAVSTGVIASAPAVASPLHSSCSKIGYAHTKAACVHVPASGSFSVTVPGTKVKLKGTGSSSTMGTLITLTRVAPPHPNKGGVGTRVTASGHFNPLKPSKGKLYWFTASNNSLKKVSTVSRTGIYQLVP